MKTRLLISLFLVPAAAFILFFNNHWPFTVLVVAALTAALVEVYNLLMKKGLKPYRTTGAIFGVLIYAIAIMKYPPMTFMLAWAFLIIILFGLIVLSRDFNNFTRAGATAFPLMYVSTLGMFALYLRALENGYYLVILMMFLTYIYDAGAYFAGSFLGRHKLIPEISPGKTMEGCAGGIVINVITAVILKYTVLPDGLLGPNTLLHVMVLAVLLAVTGQIGDLAESVLKRYCGEKNSSNLMPEMGGVLDKVDSVLFNAPVAYFYLLYVTKLF